MPLHSCRQVVWRYRLLLTLLAALTAVACFTLSLRFPPLYEAAVDIDVAAEIGPLPPEFLRPGSPIPSVEVMERAYYAGLHAPKSWFFAKAVAKQLEAYYGWRVVGTSGADVDGVLIQEIEDGLSATKRGARGLTVRVRNHDPWRAGQFAAAVRDLLRDDGGRFLPAARRCELCT